METYNAYIQKWIKIILKKTWMICYQYQTNFGLSRDNGDDDNYQDMTI